MELRTQLQNHLGSAFAVERELGGGGMSRVFLAQERRLSRKVVIKVLAPELVQGINAERFEREILLAASLQQANIVPVLAAGEVDGLPYFTMPFIEGESLRSRLTDGGLPIAEVVGILRDVTRALVYAHERGIVHRDIKPDNVLISGVTAVVTDFGIAKALAASQRPDHTSARDRPPTLTMMGTSIGTPAYMAPEQVAGDPDLDHRVDLYALGCLGYELLTGQPPFADLPPQKMLAAHLSQEAGPVSTQRPDCPPALAALVMQLLAKDPEHRLQQAREVLHTLDDTGSISHPMFATSSPIQLRHNLLLLLGATVLVAAVSWAAVTSIGLPTWVFNGAVLIMLLGLPILLLTEWARRTAVGATIVTTGGSTGRTSGTLNTIALKASRHLSWRRMVRAGIAAMTAFVLLVAGFVITRSLGIGPAGSLLAAGTLSSDDQLLLADFVVAPEDSALGPIVVEAVRAAMSQSRSIRMLPPAEVANALVQMERSPGTRLSLEIAREVAARTGVRAILGGRLVRAGNGYLVSLELVGVQGAAPLASYQGNADDAGDLLDVVDRLSRKLRGRVGESLRQVQRSVPLQQATTTSLEALRLYTEGTHAQDVEQDYEKAVRLLRQAVAIDSAFALAWRKLSVAMYNAQLPPAVRDSALDRAVKYVDKLPLRERHLVMGGYYEHHSVHNHRGRALSEYRALYDLDSNEITAINQLAITYAERHQQDSTLRYFQRMMQLRPHRRIVLNVVRSLIYLERLPEAARLLDSLEATDPTLVNNPGFTRAAAMLAYSRGDLAATRAKLLQGLGSSVQASDRTLVLSLLGTLSRLGGQLHDASQRVAEVSRITSSLGNLSSGPLEAVNTDIHSRGKLRSAIERADRYVASAEWRQAPAQQRPYRMLALLYAEAGAPEKARRMLELNRIEDPEGFEAFTDHNFKASAEGMVLLAEGKPEQALEQFKLARLGPDGMPTGCQACIAYMIARGHAAAGRADSARVWLENYLAVPPVERLAPDGAFLASVRRQLGRLYDQAGDRGRAIEQYAAFVRQWADADAELQPMVRNIQARIDELTAESETP